MACDSQGSCPQSKYGAVALQAKKTPLASHEEAPSTGTNLDSTSGRRRRKVRPKVTEGGCRDKKDDYRTFTAAFGGYCMSKNEKKVSCSNGYNPQRLSSKKDCGFIYQYTCCPPPTPRPTTPRPTAQPTPEPTAPTPRPPTEPTCKESLCSGDTENNWSVKCYQNWKCNGCEPCLVLENCKKWCARHTNPWSHKCEMKNNCAGCDDCADLTGADSTLMDDIKDDSELEAPDQ